MTEPTPPTTDVPDEPAGYPGQLGHVVAVLAVGAFLLYARSVPLGNGELWAELSSGRAGLAGGATEPGWLGDALLYRAYALGADAVGGPPLSRFEGGVAALGLLGWLLALALAVAALAVYRLRGGSIGLAAAALVLLVPVVPLLVGTPETKLLGRVAFLALLGLLTPARSGWSAALLVPAVLVAWANLDGWFPVGVVLVGVVAVGRWIDDGGLSIKGAAAPLLAGLGLGVAALAVATPAGPALFADLAATWRHPALERFAPWQPMNFSDWRPVHVAFLASLALLTVAPFACGRPFRAAELAPLFGFAVAALVVQGVADFWFLLVPWLALPALRGLAERREWESEPAPAWAALAGVLAVLFLLTLPVGWLLRGPTPAAQALRPDVPWAVALALRAPDGLSKKEPPMLPKLTRPLANYKPEGRFVGAILAGEYPSDVLDFLLEDGLPEGTAVFLTSRLHRYPPERYADHQAMRAPRFDGWELLDRQGVNLVVLSPADDRALLADLAADRAAWELVPGTPNWSGEAASAPVVLAIRKRPVGVFHEKPAPAK